MNQVGKAGGGRMPLSRCARHRLVASRQPKACDHGTGSHNTHPRRTQAPKEGADEEAYFSEGEPESPVPQRLVEDERAGFDFSGTVCAYAGQPLCPRCSQPLKPTWDARREEIVVERAVLLRWVIYHEGCARQTGQYAGTLVG